MTDQERIQELEIRIQELEIQELETADTTFEEVSRMLKKSKDLYKSNARFWNSRLTTKFLSEFKSNNWLLEFLLGYFSNPTNQNIIFTKQVAENYPKDLVKSIKLSQVFYEDDWFNHFESVLRNNSDSNLLVFFKEIKFLRGLHQDWEKKASIHKNILAKISYEKLLEIAVYLLEEIKKPHKVQQNKNLAERTEMNVCYVLKELLNHKKGQTDNINNAISNKEIADVIDFIYSYHLFTIQVEKYCAGYVNFEGIPDKSYAIHRKNEYKSRFQERLIFTKSLEKFRKSSAPKSEKQILTEALYIATPVQIETNLQYFDYLKIPLEYTWQSSKIEMKKVFEIIATINNSTEIFIKFNSKEDLIQDLVSRLDYLEKETELIIDFLTTDLRGDEKVDFLCKPFIKIDSQYFWLTSLLVNRKWGALMHTRLSKEDFCENESCNNINKLLRKACKDIEVVLTEAFENNDFIVLKGKKEFNFKDISLDDTRKTEIDTFAFKNGILFLIEIKITSRSEGLLDNVKYNAQTIEFKASQQLDYAKEYVESLKADKFKEKFGFDKSEIIEIKILVASNIYEHHNSMVNKKYLKVSIFQLLAILNNDFQYLNQDKMSFYQYDKKINMNDTILNKAENLPFVQPFSLWSGEKCTANDLTEAIEQNKIWDFLDKMYDFSKSETIELTTFENFDKNWLG